MLNQGLLPITKQRSYYVFIVIAFIIATITTSELLPFLSSIEMDGDGKSQHCTKGKVRYMAHVSTTYSLTPFFA